MDDASSRRVFLKGAAALGSALLTLPLETEANAVEISGGMPWQPDRADAPIPATPGALQYFTEAEAVFIDAAIARLIPKDELGPGARELDVTVFIDRQLSGDFGNAVRWYMQGPFDEKAAGTFGYQTHFTPAELYRAAIRAIDAYAAKTSKGRIFARLKPEEQDKLLSALENGEVPLEGVSGQTFFELLLQNTIEGFFCDPIYGGNRDMAAWKMIGFPGARYNYRDHVGKHNQHLDLPAVGLKGGPEWRSNG